MSDMLTLIKAHLIFDLTEKRKQPQGNANAPEGAACVLPGKLSPEVAVERKVQQSIFIL